MQPLKQPMSARVYTFAYLTRPLLSIPISPSASKRHGNILFYPSAHSEHHKDCLGLCMNQMAPVEGYCTQYITRFTTNYRIHHHRIFQEKRALHLWETKSICTTVGNMLATHNLYTGCEAQKARLIKYWTQLYIRRVVEEILSGYSGSSLPGKIALSWAGTICPSDLHHQAVWSWLLGDSKAGIWPKIA